MNLLSKKYPTKIYGLVVDVAFSWILQLVSTNCRHLIVPVITHKWNQWSRARMWVIVSCLCMLCSIMHSFISAWTIVCVELISNGNLLNFVWIREDDCKCFVAPPRFFVWPTFVLLPLENKTTLQSKDTEDSQDKESTKWSTRATANWWGNWFFTCDITVAWFIKISVRKAFHSNFQTDLIQCAKFEEATLPQLSIVSSEYVLGRQV